MCHFDQIKTQGTGRRMIVAGHLDAEGEGVGVPKTPETATPQLFETTTPDLDEIGVPKTGVFERAR